MNTYTVLQFVQMGSLLWPILRFWKNVIRGKLRIVDSHFAIIVIGYGLTCSLSGLLRADSDFNAIAIISDDEYVSGVLWWCCSLILTCEVYLSTLIWRAKGRRFGNLLYIDADKKMHKTYAIIGCLLLISFYINPFRKTDFGVLNATGAADLAVGGLLVSGLIAILISAVALTLLKTVLVIGLPMFGVSLYYMIESGSKGLAAVYCICGAIQIGAKPSAFKKLGSWTKLKKVAGSVAVLAAAIILITISVSARFGGERVDAGDALKAALARFTQSDVGILIYKSDTWRQQASSEYRKNVALSFVPGFLWKDKPLNFAYEINRLLGKNFTAASPSFFGAVYLACDGWFYWVWICLIAFMIGLWSDWVIGYPHCFGRHLFWYGIFTMAMLFEGNWVLFVVQLLICSCWRLILGYKMRFRYPRLS